MVTFSFGLISKHLKEFLLAAAKSINEVPISCLLKNNMVMDGMRVQANDTDLKVLLEGAVKLEDTSFNLPDGQKITFPLLMMTSLEVRFKVLPTISDESIILFKMEKLP